jgi:hypothetical protein
MWFPNAISIPSWKELKFHRWAGECGVKVKE